MRLALIILIFAMSSYGFAGPPPTPKQNTALFECGLLEGCFQDLEAIRILLDGMAPVLNEFAKKPGANDIQGEVLSLEQKIESCNQSVLESCQVNLSRARSSLEKKIRFLTDDSASPAFPWNENNKKLHRDSVVRKLCSGSISLESIEKIDALLFFNTPCTGTGFFKYLPGLSAVPGVENIKANNPLCRPGMQATTTLSVNGGTHSSSYIFISSDSTTSGILTPDHVISNLDSNLIHEFVHYQRDSDPDFKRRTDGFLAIRYPTARQKYLGYTDRLQKEIRAEALRVQMLPNLTDSQRNSLLADFVRKKAKAFDQWLSREQMPVSQGSGSDNASYSSLGSGPAHASDIYSSPEFINGIAQKYHYTDYVTISAGRPYGRKLTFDVADAYGLTSSEEYVAVALATYRNDPASAIKNYSVEELRWLRENWRYGYLSR